MRLPVLVCAAVLCHLAIAAAPREVSYAGSLTPLNITPTFDKGYLFVYAGHEIDVFGPDGTQLFGIAAQVENAKTVSMDNAAVDADGTLAGAVRYSVDGTSRGEGGGIALFDASGKQVRFFDTGGYHPTQIAFGPDHSLWTLGWPGAQHGDDAFFVLRNYSRDGEELGHFLPRSSFDREPDPIGPEIGMWQLRVIGDRVGAVMYESPVYRNGQKYHAMLWVETDLKGRELGRWEVGADPAPQAFTQSGGLYIRDGKQVSVFDRNAKAWRRVPISADGTLLGADGDNLVFLQGPNTLRWVPAGE